MKLTHERMAVRARHRFATSQGGMDEKEVIVVRIEHEGVTGWGEVVPSELYGQSLESSEAALDAAAQMLGDDPYTVNSIMHRLLATHDGQRAAMSAIDSALHDWIGRRLKLPVWKLLGLDRPRKQTTFTIGVADMAEIRVKVEEALAEGYDALKVKVGIDQDHETLSLIRNVFKGPLFLDANQAWSPSQAIEKIRGLQKFRPALIEQPLRSEDWPAMAELCKLGVAPIFADESCERPADVIRLRGCVDGVNIKFTKCGGIREAMRMVTLARAFNLGVMLGCFVSSSLAIAPALTIATLADYADLDGHLLLANDPWQGMSRTGGIIELSDRPGLGLERKPA